MAEIVDVVNSKDEIIGETPREGIHKTDHLHRAVHIFLVNDKNEIWLEKRAQTTDTYPGCYNSSAGGHVSKGESYIDAAHREALEELGLSNLKLEWKHKLIASPEILNEFVMFYVCHSNLEPRVHEFTEKLEPFSIDKIDLMIANGEKFVSIFLLLFDWYKKNEI